MLVPFWVQCVLAWLCRMALTRAINCHLSKWIRQTCKQQPTNTSNGLPSKQQHYCDQIRRWHFKIHSVSTIYLLTPTPIFTVHSKTESLPLQAKAYRYHYTSVYWYPSVCFSKNSLYFHTDEMDILHTSSKKLAIVKQYASSDKSTYCTVYLKGLCLV